VVENSVGEVGKALRSDSPFRLAAGVSPEVLIVIDGERSGVGLTIIALLLVCLDMLGLFGLGLVEPPVIMRPEGVRWMVKHGKKGLEPSREIPSPRGLLLGSEESPTVPAASSA